MEYETSQHRRIADDSDEFSRQYWKMPTTSHLIKFLVEGSKEKNIWTKQTEKEGQKKVSFLINYCKAYSFRLVKEKIRMIESFQVLGRSKK